MICFLDLDGVLVDFVGGAFAFHRKSLPYDEIRWDFVKQLGMPETDFWTPLGEEFWAGLKPTPEASNFYILADAFAPGDVFLLSSPCLTKGCATGKARWVERYFPSLSRRLLLTHRKEVLAGPGRALIDDSDHNTGEWAMAGGQTVLVPRPWNEHRGLDPVGYVRERLKAIREGT